MLVDQLLVRRDGVRLLDVRNTRETEDAPLIYMRYDSMMDSAKWRASKWLRAGT